MKKITFVSGNIGKIEEMQELLAPEIKIESYKLDLVEPQSLDLEYIASYKAQQAFDLLKTPVIVDDVGVFFHEFENFPGSLAKYFFIGMGGAKGIYKKFPHPMPATFQGVISYMDETLSKPICFVGEAPGVLDFSLDVEPTHLMFNAFFKSDEIGGEFILENYDLWKKKASQRRKASIKLKKYLLS